ncbi:MAG: MFS transporter [Halieaceae bacterium]
MKRSLRVNIVAIYLMGFFHSFMVVIPVFVPLLQGYGLSMAQVLQTQALFALTVALLEVPSGYIADLWGRRRAILVGSLLNAVGFFSLLWADDFGDFLLYEFILGLGISLISGADLALLYDTETTLAERGEGGGAGASKSLSRLISVEAGASGVAGIVASLLLIHSNMELLILVQAVAGFMPLLLGFLLVEAPRPRLHLGHAGNARAIINLLVFGKPVVLWTTLAIAAFGLLAVYVFWIYQKYWEMQGIPVTWFGYIWAAFALTVSVSARYAGALEARLGWRRLLWIAAALPLLGLLGMALASGWVGVLFGFAVQLSRGLSLTLFYDALNRRVPGDFRATVNSLVSLGVRGLFILTGPLLGWSLDQYGITSTLLTLLCVFAPVFLLVIAGLGRRIQVEAAEPAAQPAN